MLTYSVRPRGGVVHALEVAEALAARGHEVELFALGAARATRSSARRGSRRTVVRHVPPPRSPFDARIAAMIAAYATACADRSRDGGFDVVHAQDCLSANAALDAARRGPDPARDPHRPPRRRLHARRRSSPASTARSSSPTRVLCVSPPWVERVRDEFGVRGRARAQRRRPRALPARPRRGRARATARARGPRRPPRRAHRRRHRAAQGLAHAARGLRGACAASCPSATRCCVVAGGATLFDYRDEIERFARRARRSSASTTHRARARPGRADERARAALPRRRRLRLPLGEGGLRARGRSRRWPPGCRRSPSDLDVFRGVPRRRRERAARAGRRRRGARGGARARRARRRRCAERLRAGGRAVAARHSWDARGRGARDAPTRDFLARRAPPDGRGPRGHRALARRLPRRRRGARPRGRRRRARASAAATTRA